MVNPRVYMDCAIGGKSVGRLIIQLFADTTPHTAEKFRTVCTGENQVGLNYKGSIIYRSPNVLTGGDCGSYYERQSVYGNNYLDEIFNSNHDGPGLVSLVVRDGPRFFITLTKTNVNTYPVGKVVEGLEVLNTITNDSPAVITNCGDFRLWEFTPNISASQKMSIKEFDQLASTSNKQLSNSLKEIMSVNKQLIAADLKDVLIPENEKELVETARIFQHNVDVISDLKAEICSLEKHQNELLCQTRTEISMAGKRKLVMEMIPSFSYDDLVIIENMIKNKSDSK